MTLKELREKISNAKDPGWFSKLEEEIKYLKLNQSVKLTGFVNIYRYVENQILNWDKLFESLPKELLTSKQHYKRIKSALETFLEQHIDRDERGLTAQWKNVRSALINPSHEILPSDSSEVKFLSELSSLDSNIMNGAFNFFTGTYSIHNKENFLGFLYAYEFSEKDKSHIAKRIKSERSSIAKLKNQVEDSLSQVETDIINHLKSTKEKYEEYVKIIDSLKDSKEKLFNKWYKDSTESFEKFDESKKSKISELEKTYGEKLKLEKPAKFWSSRADKLRKQGNISMVLLFLSIIAACIPLYFILWLTPEGMTESFSKDSLSAIRWSVIFVAFISFLVFGIRLLNKIVFSSFHLARDAEEREQLTLVYLALVKDAKISEEEKKLIMQSLFSRADTGLLKEDSSPTMPNDFINKIMSK